MTVIKDDNRGMKTMIIAVTYDNGNVHQHFGQAKCVKFYEAEDGEIKSSEIVQMPAAGHGFIASVLFKHFTDTLICGHIRSNAAGGLSVSGIELIAGASGDADEAVKSYLLGSLKHDPEGLDDTEVCAHDPE